MVTTKNIDQVRELIIKDLTLSDEEAEGLMISDESKIFNNLKAIIKYLLDHDFNRLINACYRLDVEQSKFQQALNSPNPDNVPEAIALLIIEREQEKIKWRLKYSS
ncbi:MAG: hypothetical protein AAFQ94_07790 [Bacteroidota bacterium]